MRRTAIRRLISPRAEVRWLESAKVDILTRQEDDSKVEAKQLKEISPSNRPRLESRVLQEEIAKDQPVVQ